MTDASAKARQWAIELAACLATGALLGAIGPFGSFLNDVLIIRVAYWVIVFLSCGLAVGLTIRIVTPRARKAGVPIWAWAPAVVLAIALPLAAFTRLVAVAFWAGIGDRVSVADWYGQTLLMCLVYLTLHAVVARSTERPEPRLDKSGSGDPRILRHLPLRLGSDLLCLSMEDHYVRLHTGGGSVLVLMSLSQALAELGDIDGLQVHRSWWVARDAVTGVIKDGRNLRLRLRGGLEAPVSRASVARLRQAGWIETR
ncbi:LytTR family DNA-binding domain-containing protein [Brevundimonas sp. PAMC22021]|uniref:LytTR family DNA-binding domain-containing protein n=1 Tax=Brevundimonas sp. PAMC22021 TaxID=2861285 RepID=UPI001C62CAFD|nr:LytTR family DNA-binding domain-containing protein [Brevundimonas sp. PAMC22021]QYF86996.1 LytTR family transcriptional regulator DNA-binding domain-containing protein [Brevundimonas sp. PAMC22021]